MQYGLIGEKLGHSFSKYIHEQIENHEYILKEIPKDEIDTFWCDKNFKAVNVTIPYKQSMLSHLDFISERAKKIGAVNTVVNKKGKLYGYNTDCLGMRAMIQKAGISISGKKVLVLGTGGTSKTARVVALEEGAEEVLIVSRSKKDNSITYDEAFKNHSDAHIIINTTPCGMYPDVDASPIDISKFPRLEGVVDAIYNPIRTKLVSEAVKKGIKAVGGLYMLVSQAVYAAEKFHGKSYPESLTDKIFDSLYSSKENIVLVGMPSSGKSTVGKFIASLTGRNFIDTDDMIVESQNMHIPEIFKTYGENKFRDMESISVKEASGYSGCVIATGGGAVLREENVASLKQNGRLYFLDRDLSQLVPTSDRPLASDAQAIQKRYKERYPIYTSVADEIIKIDADANTIAKRVVMLHSGRR